MSDWRPEAVDFLRQNEDRFVRQATRCCWLHKVPTLRRTSCTTPSKNCWRTSLTRASPVSAAHDSDANPPPVPASTATTRPCASTCRPSIHASTTSASPPEPPPHRRGAVGDAPRVDVADEVVVAVVGSVMRCADRPGEAADGWRRGHRGPSFSSRSAAVMSSTMMPRCPQCWATSRAAVPT